MRSFKTSARASVVAAGLALSLGFSAGSASAAESAVQVPEMAWQFDGIFGTFDRAQLQRGLQVYQQVCASCHGLRLVSYRNLSDLGYNEDQIKAFASEATVTDGPDDSGEMFDRPGRPSDPFPSPFPNEQAAAAANGGVAPPDLSLMAKARANGPDYLHALLTGYEEQVSEETLQTIFEHETAVRMERYEQALEAYEEALENYEEKIEDGEEATRPAAPEEPQPVNSIEDLNLADTAYFNAYFPGHAIGMPPPLYEDGVEYADGTPATIDQQSKDVSAFLMWTAEPKLEERKQTGIKVILFLIVLTAMLYALKRKIWSDVKH